MTDCSVRDLKTAWIIRKTIEVFLKKKDGFNLIEASKIKAEAEILFDKD